MKTRSLSLSTVFGFMGLILMIHFLSNQAKAATPSETSAS